MSVTAAQIQQAYVAFFNRPADPIGLQFWLNRATSANQTIAQITAAFGTSSEYTNLYSGQGDTQRVNAIYQNLFGREAEVGGLQFWAGELANGRRSISDIAKAIADSAQGTDLTKINNKVSVATDFTTALDTTAEILGYSGATAASLARTFMSTVSETQASVDAAKAAIPAQITSIVNTVNNTPGTTITLTSGVDVRSGTSGNDTFDGSVNAQGTATFTSVDNLDGGTGNDTLIAGLAGGNIAARLTSIETGEFITSAATTLDLVNVTGMSTVLLRNGSNTLTVNNIAATTGQTFTVQDQASNVTLNFANAALTGTNAFTLALSGAQSDADGGAQIDIAQQAGSDTSSLETLTLQSGGSGANFLNRAQVQNAAGTNTLATLNVTGAQGLTVATDFATTVRTVDASGMTGAVGLTAGFDATLAMTVTGSGGNDTLTFDSSAANVNIAAGNGNDVVSILGFTTDDTIAGGDGTADRLDIRTQTDAEAITANLTNTTGFEQLSLRTAGSNAASLVATRFGTIDTVRLDAGTAGSYGVTMQAGSVTLTIASPTAGDNAQLAGALTVTDTGTAASDILTITNRDTDTATTTNNYNGQNITSAGYETVNLSTGTTATVAQTVGTITLNNDSLSGANTLNVSGANNLTIANLASNSSGLLTVNASGLTGTALLSMGAAPTFSVATGTVSITGSANGDTLRGPAASAATIDGGAGADTIVTGTAADSVLGGTGNDTITAGGGNDIVDGGDGADTITMAAGTVNVTGGAGNDTIDMAATLTAGDTVSGGDGTDILRISTAATAATAAGVTGFETIRFDAGINQGLEQFSTNSGFTRIVYNAGATIAVTNAGSAVDTLQISTAGGTLSMARLVDTSTNAVTVLTTAGQTTTVLTIGDEETVTINTGSTAGAGTVITDMTAGDITSLTVTGSDALTITNAIASAANLATVNASALTAAFSANASTSTANITFTGSFSGANTMTGGTGADTMVGGTAADSLTGGNGADSISGGAAADTIIGGLGNDTLLGEIGNDTLTGAEGNDTMTGGEGVDHFVFSATASNGVDSITDFVVGTDKINVRAQFGADGNEIAPVTAAGGADSITFADNNIYYISMNGAAGNLRTGGTATLAVADLTASTLSNLATYLDERIATSGTDGHDVVLAINWTAGGSTSTYFYEHTEANNNATFQAAELVLLGVVTRGSSVLTTGDIIFAA
jgi:Ca2+-binding RTX toxin-like protein